MSDPLFEPLSIGPLQLKNRIVMPAMHLNMCADYQVTDQLCAFYAERARGGAGLIVTGYATVDELAGHPAHIGAHHDRFLPGLSRLSRTLRDGGAAGAMQLNHSGRYNYSLLLGGRQPVAPSAVVSRLTGETPRELSEEEIEAIIAAFAAASKRVAAAGFEAVEVLAGTGYLISSFLSPLTNQRSDAWGGSPAKRMRFGCEVVAAVQQASGLPVLVRVNGHDFMPGGIGREVQSSFAVALVQAGAAALSVNVGWHEAQMPQIVTKVPRGAFAYLARGIRERVAVPVVAGHRINDPATARALLKEGWCDLVAMGRALIADPNLPEKARQGREEGIRHCVACGQGCFDNLFRLHHVECLCNPQVGYEGREPAAPVVPHRVLVVGGGAGGMSAALAAARRGHAVILCERSARLGGQLALAGAAPGRGEFRQLAVDLERELAEAGVEVRLNRTVDASLLQELRPDAVLLASGGQPVRPPLPGVDGSQVVQAWEVLAGGVETGRRVVVIGGGAVGVETALLLAEEGTLPAETLKFLLVHRAEEPEELCRLATHGSKQVTVVELIDKLGQNFGRTTRWTMLQDLERYGVTSRVSAEVIAIEPEGVRIRCRGQEELLPADSVVLAVGTRPENPLAEICAGLGIPCTLVGDARRPGLVFDAVHQGDQAGRELA